MEESAGEGESPVSSVVSHVRCVFVESRTLELVRKMGGNFLLKLNIDSRPIANKYREGKVKRTLKRELKVPETARREANETSFLSQDCRRHCLRCLLWFSVNVNCVLG